MTEQQELQYFKYICGNEQDYIVAYSRQQADGIYCAQILQFDESNERDTRIFQLSKEILAKELKLNIDSITQPCLIRNSRNYPINAHCR